MAKELKVALITGSDPQDRRSFSGTMFSMASAIEKYFGVVDYLGKMATPLPGYKRILSNFFSTLSKDKSKTNRLPEDAKNLSKIISQKLSSKPYDLIFAPVASMEIAFLQTEIPIVYHSDATFRLLHGLYGRFPEFSKLNMVNENFFEQAAINRADLIIYPSEWAASSAINDYGADPKKIRIIQYGANIEKAPDREAVINKSISNSIIILFLAKEWERKGGGLAYETLLALLDKGISADMIICGLKPQKKYRHPRIKYFEYLDKNKQKDRDLFEKILFSAHLLLLPTRADCSLIVACEANAYGLPVFSTIVGGVASIVENGKNGYLLPLDATGKDFADIIEKNILNKKHYSNINIGARNQYETTLNWDTWGKNVRQAVEDIINI